MVSEETDKRNTNTEISEQDSDKALDLLKIALNETQQTIRSYDTKAQICAISYLFSLNLVLSINEVIFTTKGSDLWVVLFGWGVMLFPMLLFGLVLYPTRKTIKPSKRQDQSSIYKVLYIRHERHTSVDEIIKDVIRAKPIEEFAFELYQSSSLRDRKRVQFVRALMSAGLALLIMFSVHLTTVVSRMGS